MADQSVHMKQFEEAKTLHNNGVDGDKKAVIKANEMFLKLREAEPGNALIEAYYGSTLVLLGRDAVNILERADKAQEGLDALNRAVSLDSNHKEIRLLRGNICLRLPESFFHCSETAIADFTFLLDHYKENSNYLTPKQVREILRNLSAAYQNAGKPDKANSVLQRLDQLELKKKNIKKEREETLTFNERLDKIISLCKKGAKGNVTAVQEANQLLERLRLDYPDHPHAEAYHGSIMLLIARNKTTPLERLKWAKNGLKLLDKAVAAAPHDSRIRYLRGRSAYRLPEKYFQQTRTVIEDYTFLIDRESLQEGIIGANDYMKLTYELGEAYRRIGRNEDAARCWTKLEQQTQDPEFRKLLRLKLQSLEGKPSVEHIPANDSITSILMGKAARAAGNILLKWAEKEINGNKKEEEKIQEAPRKHHKKKIRH